MPHVFLVKFKQKGFWVKCSDFISTQLLENWRKGAEIREMNSRCNSSCGQIDRDSKVIVMRITM